MRCGLDPGSRTRQAALGAAALGATGSVDCHNLGHNDSHNNNDGFVPGGLGPFRKVRRMATGWLEVILGAGVSERNSDVESTSLILLQSYSSLSQTTCCKLHEAPSIESKLGVALGLVPVRFCLIFSTMSIALICFRFLMRRQLVRPRARVELVRPGATALPSMTELSDGMPCMKPSTRVIGRLRASGSSTWLRAPASPTTSLV